MAVQHAFLEHCAIRYEDINAGGGALFLGWNSHRWSPLTVDAQGPLGRAREATEDLELDARLSVLASEPGRLRALKDSLGLMFRVLEQSDDTSGAPGSSIAAIGEGVTKCGVDVLDVIENLPSAHRAGGRLLVPDTNALAWAPDLTKWVVENPATLVLVPRVVEELDDLKMRDGSIGEKAKKLIRQLDGFDARGNTLEGIKVAGKLSLREVALHPDPDLALDWLRLDHADDSILAAALELGRRDLRADVALVTRDRNMKNRARHAGLPVVSLTDLVGEERG